MLKHEAHERSRNVRGCTNRPRYRGWARNFEASFGNEDEAATARVAAYAPSFCYSAITGLARRTPRVPIRAISLAMKPPTTR